MDFLKKHYEKILLTVVLLGSVGLLVAMPFFIKADQEDAETSKLDLFALLQGDGHQFEDAFDQLAAILARQADFLMDRFAEVRPRNRRALHAQSCPHSDATNVP